MFLRDPYSIIVLLINQVIIPLKPNLICKQEQLAYDAYTFENREGVTLLLRRQKYEALLSLKNNISPKYQKNIFFKTEDWQLSQVM